MTRHPRYKNVAKAEFAEWLFWLACCGCVVIVWDYCMDFDWPGLQSLASAPPLGTSKWDDAHLVLDSPSKKSYTSCFVNSSARCIYDRSPKELMFYFYGRVLKENLQTKEWPEEKLPRPFVTIFSISEWQAGTQANLMLRKQVLLRWDMIFYILNHHHQFQKEILIIITTGIIQMIIRKLGRVIHTFTKDLSPSRWS